MKMQFFERREPSDFAALLTITLSDGQSLRVAN